MPYIKSNSSIHNILRHQTSRRNRTRTNWRLTNLFYVQDLCFDCTRFVLILIMHGSCFNLLLSNDEFEALFGFGWKRIEMLKRMNWKWSPLEACWRDSTRLKAFVVSISDFNIKSCIYINKRAQVERRHAILLPFQVRYG